MEIIWGNVKASDLKMFCNSVVSKDILKDISIFELRFEYQAKDIHAENSWQTCKEDICKDSVFTDRNV